MKKNRSMIAAVALLAVMCAGYGAVSFGVAQSEKHRQEEEAADAIYLTDFEEVTGISVASQEQTMNFEKKEGEWLDADDPERPLKQSLVALLASSGQKLTAVRKLEGAGELSNYGLDDPAYRAVFSDDNGKEAAILVGDELDDGRFYAKLEDQADVYTIDSGLVSAMDYSDLEFTQPQVLPAVNSDEVQQIRVTGSGQEAVYSRDDGTLTDEMAAAAGFVLGDCAAWKPGEEELAEMGFDGSQRTLSYTYVPSAEEETESGTADAESGAADAESGAAVAESGAAVAESSAADADTASAEAVVLEIGGLNEAETDYYVRLNGSQMVLLMSKSALEEFL